MKEEACLLLIPVIILSAVICIFSFKSKKENQSVIVNFIALGIYGIPLLLGFLVDSNGILSFICFIYLSGAMAVHTLLLLLIGFIKVVIRLRKE